MKIRTDWPSSDLVVAVADFIDTDDPLESSQGRVFSFGPRIMARESNYVKKSKVIKQRSTPAKSLSQSKRRLII